MPANHGKLWLAWGVFHTKAQSTRRIVPELVAQTPPKLLLHQVELLRPNRIRAGDSHLSLPFGHRLGRRRHPLADNLLPDRLHSRKARFRSGPAERRVERLGSRPGDAAMAHAAAERATSNGIRIRRSRAAAGTDSSAAAVIKV